MNSIKKALPLLLLAVVLVIGITMLVPQTQAVESDLSVSNYVYENVYSTFVHEIVYDHAAIIGCDWGATDIYIPEYIDGYPVTEISDYAFIYCENLQSISLPETVEYIGTYAFCECSSLESIQIPNGVTYITYATFDGCSALKEISIPESVTTIESKAFSGCDSLQEVYYGGSEEQWNHLDIWDPNEPLWNATVYFGGNAATGDITGDNEINNDDVVYLLWHVLFPNEYPMAANGDLTGDNEVNNDDVVLLLWHVLFPNEYPL